jgi:crossover junction endodeoxyribonuclease RuvC
LKTNKVLGIDPGLDRTGWAVVEDNGPAGLVLNACGLIHTAAGTPLPQRLEEIYTEIRKVAEVFAPEAAAMEEMFFLKRALTMSHTIQTRGVIMLALHQKGLSINAYPPKRVKMVVCGSGSADKKQVQRMVQLTLKLKEAPRPDDVADAAAIAICHLKTSPLMAKISAQQKFLDKLKEAKKQQVAALKSKLR